MLCFSEMCDFIFYLNPHRILEKNINIDYTIADKMLGYYFPHTVCTQYHKIYLMEDGLKFKNIKAVLIWIQIKLCQKIIPIYLDPAPGYKYVLISKLQSQRRLLFLNVMERFKKFIQDLMQFCLFVCLNRLDKYLPSSIHGNYLFIGTKAIADKSVIVP